MAKQPNVTSNERKATREREVFAHFVHSSRLDIDLTSIESCEPSEPDIACRSHEGERFAFELVEMCNEDIIKGVAQSGGPGGSGVYLTWTSDQREAILLKKLKKRYASDVPVDLLCYTDGRFTSPDDLAIDELRATINREGQGQFRSIWFYGEDGVHQIA